MEFDRLKTLLLMALLLAVMMPVSVFAQPNYSVKAPLATRSLLLDGVTKNGDVVLVGERGHVLISGDVGATWEQMNVPTRTTLTGVYFQDRNTGFAVSYYQEILRTKDGGKSWKVVHAKTDDERPLLDIWFKDANIGFAIGAYGLFLKTEDGGSTWRSETLNVTKSFAEEDGISDEESALMGAFGFDEEEAAGFEDAEEEYIEEFCLNHIISSATGRIFIAAEMGTIYRSDDGGQSWASLASPYHGSFLGILALDGDSLLFLGLRGHMYRTDDGGDTWQEIDTGTGSTLMGGVRLDDGRIIITGLAGTVLVSRDGGNNFTYYMHPSRKDIMTSVAPDGKTVLLIGQFGVKKLQIDGLTVNH
ncbi:MAG: hypothetical protein HF978_09700 [Desulfobacteraceae bacterium]|nr:hypothetical protein [Desulfobacteraceae bacterium]MBC2755810.1 hypothetical protein [Desulfobacteraceae bacterium]